MSLHISEDRFRAIIRTIQSTPSMNFTELSQKVGVRNTERFREQVAEVIKLVSAIDLRLWNLGDPLALWRFYRILRDVRGLTLDKLIEMPDRRLKGLYSIGDEMVRRFRQTFPNPYPLLAGKNVQLREIEKHTKTLNSLFSNGFQDAGWQRAMENTLRAMRKEINKVLR